MIHSVLFSNTYTKRNKRNVRNKFFTNTDLYNKIKEISEIDELKEIKEKGYLRMGKIFSITNQKGGVGKTTTSHAMICGLKLKGYKVLGIDLDPQANLTYSMGAESENINTIYEVMKGEVKVSAAIQHTEQGDIIGSTILLSSADLEFIRTGKEYILTEALKEVKREYDFIIIDTPPALGILTVNAFTASSSVIVPVGADIYSIQGIGQLNNTIETIKKYCNQELSIMGILLTRYNKRTILSRDLAESISEMAVQLKTSVFDAVIREGISIKEAQAQRINILEYDPKANTSKDYKEFIDEFLKKQENYNG